MTTTRLTGVQQTLSPVLRAKALDNRLPDPILGDGYAERAMRGLDPDYDGTGSQIGAVAVIRARNHDDWAREYLAAHPDAVVLHPGCGLDARVFRLDPPASVAWYDLDYPEVTALRRELLPEREHYRLLSGSVTDRDWLAEVPHDRPVLFIAEGLVPYLTEAQLRRLLTDIVDTFPTGQLQLETIPVWAQRSSKWDPTLRRYGGARFRCGFKDPRVLADWHPKLGFVDETGLSDSPLLSHLPVGTRLAYRAMNLVGFAKSVRQLRLRF